MRTRRLWVLLAGIVLTAVGTAVTVSYAASPDRSPDTAIVPAYPNLASINHQNRNLFHVPKARHHVVVGEQARRIVIPALGLDSPVIRTVLINGGTDWQVADWAVGDMVGSPNPGTCTLWAGIHDCTTALSGHDDIKGELFKRIGDLRNGAKVILYTKRSVFTYKVDGRHVIPLINGQAAVGSDVQNYLFSSNKSVVLVACTPYWVDTSRILVTAALTGERSRR